MNAPACSILPDDKSGAIDLLSVPILDGVFNAEESREPVLQLLLDLLSFHQKRNFNHQERFGQPDPWSEKMQAALTEALENAKRMIDDANQSNTPLVLESGIRIERLRS
ncbi:MAG: hypothetical protein OQJ89_06120 [Kangiellaceae bacterium]|nr:hypothetical protein [Kangiellaceae bacterium]MCW8999671.1 hypothetical protein [Kangiellaceae bacterium]MCW9016517.1 hypothetical protein [Kangiellaceae bacterium]